MEMSDELQRMTSWSRFITIAFLLHIFIIPEIYCYYYFCGTYFVKSLVLKMEFKCLKLDGYIIKKFSFRHTSTCWLKTLFYKQYSDSSKIYFCIKFQILNIKSCMLLGWKLKKNSDCLLVILSCTKYYFEETMYLVKIYTVS